jgi:hypothetical protein
MHLQYLNGQEDGRSFKQLGISRSKRAVKERVKELRSFLENPSEYLYS